MIAVHRTLQPDTIIHGMCILKNANNGRPALAVAQGSTMHIMDPTTLKILESYPFKTPIALIASFGNAAPEVFVLLRNLNWFIFNLPELKRYGSIITQGMIKVSRRVLPIKSPFDIGSTGSNSRITESIRIKEQQFAFATHPDYIALSVLSGRITIIPRNRGMFDIPVSYTNIVDLAFMGPTVVSARLAILTDSKKNNRELHVCKIIGVDLEEEFSLPLPPDAYSMIPLHPEVESSIIISTNDGIHRITAPIDLPLKCEHLSTFVSTISISSAPLGDELYLILDAEGCICAASFPIDGRPRVERLLQTNAVAGSIIFLNQSVIVSSPYTDLISYSFDRDESSCRMDIQAKLPISGPIRHIATHDDNIYISNDSIRLFEKTIECRTAAITEIGNCLSIFSSNLFVCLSYIESSRILTTDDNGFIFDNVDGFIYDSPTVFFGEVKNGAIQITDKQISIIGGSSTTLNYEVSCASAENDMAVVCSKNRLIAIEISEFKEIHNLELDSQILLVHTNGNKTAVLTANRTIHIFDEFFNRYSVPLVSILGYTSIAVSKDKNGNDIVFLGTNEGKLVKVTNSGILVESVGTESITLHSNMSGKFVCSGSPPTLIGCETVFLGTEPCTDIVVVGDNFVSLSGTQLRLLTAESPGGSSKPILQIEDLVSFTILHANNMPIFAARIGDFSIKTFVNMKPVEEFVSLHAISLMERVTISNFDYLLIGDEDNEIILLDTNLSLVAKKSVGTLPTAACCLNDHIVVANRTYIEMYRLKNTGSVTEFERTSLAKTYSLTTCLSPLSDFVIVGDSNQAIAVLNAAMELAETSRDSYFTGVSCVGTCARLIFAANYNSLINVYMVSDQGVLFHIGVFQTDSRVLSFSKLGDRLIYGTEGGGIGMFTLTMECNDLKNVSQALDEIGVYFIDQRVPESKFEWPDQNIIVDADNIKIALNMPECLEMAGTTRENVKQRLKQFD